jgi:yecA family protein
MRVDTSLPAHAEVNDALIGLKIGIDAAELHGALCGFLCAGGDPARQQWLQQLALEGDHVPKPQDGDPLDRLYVASRSQLDDDDPTFDLLLPDDDDIDIRADALLGWCRGFLGGFGLAGADQPALSEEGREALEDLAKIAGSELSYEDPEADEEALTEVGEFIRVAALLLHSDRHRRAPGSQRVH